MGWLRANRRGGGALALIALALQLIVSFAHVHVATGAPQGGHLLPVASPPAPFFDNDEHPSDEPQAGLACDLCATLNLLGTALVAAAPSFAPPLLAAAAQEPAASDVAPARHRGFAQSRAPPTA